MAITTPPLVVGFSTPAPNRAQPDFSIRGDAYMGEMQPFVDETNALADWEHTTALQVEADATAVANALGLTQYKGVYSAGATYETGESVVSMVGGDFWMSNTDTNTGNPLTPSAFWAKIDLTSIAVQTSGFNLDWSQEDILKFTATADFAVTFSNIPTGGLVIVEIKSGGDWTPTFPASVVGDIPALATGVDSTVLGFYTSNGGATITVSAYQSVVAI